MESDHDEINKVFISYGGDQYGKNPITGKRYPITPKRLKEDLKGINLSSIKKKQKKLRIKDHPFGDKQKDYFYDYAQLSIRSATGGSGRTYLHTKCLEDKMAFHIVESENKRNPDLNLMLFEKRIDFINMFIAEHNNIQKTIEGGGFREKDVLVIACVPERGFPLVNLHYHAFHIKFSQRRCPSFVIFGPPSDLDGLTEAIKARIDHSIEKSKNPIRERDSEKKYGTKIEDDIHLFNTKCYQDDLAVNSFMHALSNALKLYEHKDDFTQKAHESIDSNIDIPADFYEHAEDPTVIPNFNQKKNIILKSSNETLEDHLLSYQARTFKSSPQENSKERKKNKQITNTSILGFRLRTIKNTLYYVDKEYT